MAKLSKEEQAQLDALRAKAEAPDEEEDDGDGDDGHVIVLRGSRADAFLTSLLGPSRPAKKTAPPAKAGNGKRPPAQTQGDGEADADDDDQGDAEQQDAPPPRANRYFR